MAAVVLVLLGVPGRAAAAPSGNQALLEQGAGMRSHPSVRVQALQRALVRLGVDVGRSGVDGRFGPRTAAAVRAFQRRRHLVVDGIVGPRTRRALAAALARPGVGQSARRARGGRRGRSKGRARAPHRPHRPAPARAPAGPASAVQPPLAHAPPADVPTVAAPAARRPERPAAGSRAGFLIAVALALAVALGGSAALARRAARPPEPWPERPRSTTPARPACKPPAPAAASHRPAPAGAGPPPAPRAAPTAAPGPPDPRPEPAVSPPDPRPGPVAAETPAAAPARTGRPTGRERARLIERVAAMRADGMTLQGIADRLNADGTPTLRGDERWRPSKVRTALEPPRSHRRPQHAEPRVRQER